jgi:hypothetical protein
MPATAATDSESGVRRFLASSGVLLAPFAGAMMLAVPARNLVRSNISRPLRVHRGLTSALQARVVPRLAPLLAALLQVCSYM